VLVVKIGSRAPAFLRHSSEVRWSFLPRQGSHIVAFERLSLLLHMSNNNNMTSQQYLTRHRRSPKTVSHQDAYLGTRTWTCDTLQTTIRHGSSTWAGAWSFARSLHADTTHRRSSNEMGSIMNLHWHHCLRCLRCLQSRN
jgi:hypothetical protein